MKQFGVRALVLIVVGWSLFSSAVPAEKETDHPAEISFLGIKSPVAVTNPVPFAVEIRSLVDAATFQLRIGTTPAFQLRPRAGALTNVIMHQTGPVRAYGTTNRFEGSFAVVGEKETGQLVIHLTACDSAGRPIKSMSATLNGYIADGRLYYGRESLIALQNLHIDDLERRKLITSEEARRRRYELTRLQK